MSDREKSAIRPACGSCCLTIRGISVHRIVLWLIAITVASFIIGFGILTIYGDFPPSPDQSFSPLRHSAMMTPNTTTVPSDNATSADVRLTLGAGELALQGGAPPSALMESTVFSRAAVWQPDLVQTLNNSVKTVTMTDKGHKGKAWFAVDSPNSWEIRMNDRVLLRLDVNVGAGDSTLNLGTLNLETLSTHTGAGDTTIDLTGYHGGRFNAVIKTGIGDLTLRIPRNSNMRILVHSPGIGDVTSRGLVQNNETYVTEGFNSSQPVTEIIVNQGVGSISLESV